MFEDPIITRNLFAHDIEILRARKNDIQLGKSGVFLCMAGQLNITIDGEKYTLKKNSIIVYFSFSSLKIDSFTEDVAGFLLGANLEMLQPLFYSTTNFNALYTIKQHPIQEIGDAQVTRFMELMKIFNDTARRAEAEKVAGLAIDTPIRELSLKQKELLTSTIIFEVIQCYANLPIDTSHQTRKDELLQNFVTELYKSYRTEHEVNYYAEQQYLTSRYFSAIIKERSGKSPSQWIATALLVDAKSLLSKTNKSIKDIAETLGFPTQSYFGKWFKNITGIGPLEFRNGKPAEDNTEKNFTDVVARGIRYNNDI